MDAKAAIRIAVGEKCQRCWRTCNDVSIHPYWPGWRVCARCVSVLLEVQPPFVINTDGTATLFESEAAYLKSVNAIAQEI